MTAKTLRNKECFRTSKTPRNKGCRRTANTSRDKWSIDYTRRVRIDYTRGVSREQRANLRRKKITPSLISNGSGHTKSYNRFSPLFKLLDADAKLIDAEMKQRAAEELLFYKFPDRDVSSMNFEEKSFGCSPPRSANNAQELSSIVVSLALFDGDRMLFACSGIPIPEGKQSQLHLSRFVTSVELVKAFDRHRNRDEKLRDADIAIVTSCGFLSVEPVDLVLDAPATAREGFIIAAGRAFKTGSLMTMPATDPNDSCWVSDSPNFSEAVLGGPLVEVENPSYGNGMRFLGVNLRRLSCDDANVRYSFLSREVLLQRLKHFRILDCKEFHFREYSLPDGVLTIIPSGFVHTINRLKYLGYPIPPPLVLEFNGQLLNRFEGYFGRVRPWTGFSLGRPPVGSGEHVWKLLSKKAVRDIPRRVVKLASFKGPSRFFACTGLLIKWHARTVILTSASLVRGHDGLTVDDSLKIEVSLPPNQNAIGTLELYNLSSNYAIVSMEKNFHWVRLEDIFNKNLKSPKKVVAVGRDATYGLLMASMGELTPGNSEYDMLSTCRINKAGIGGPLINLGGSFVGMNFYNGSKLTPAVPRSKIAEALGRTEAFELLYERALGNIYFEGTIEIDDNGEILLQHPNENLDIARWNAPKPYWFHGALDVYRYHIPELIGRTLN